MPSTYRTFKNLLPAVLLLSSVAGRAQVSLNLPANNPVPSIVAAEYYFDTDPGPGAGVSLPITTGVDVSGTYPVNISALSTGAHRLYVRTKDADGNWSYPNSRVFVSFTPFSSLPANPGGSRISRAEYFVDTDPGIGLGTAIPLTADTAVTISNFAADITGLPNGIHYIYFRTQDEEGRWSQNANSKFSILIMGTVVIPATAPMSDIVQLEYFFDADPGAGNGTPLTVPATTDLSNYTFAANISALPDGPHTLYVRTVKPWSLTNSISFSKSVALPVRWLSFNARREQQTVALQWKTTQDDSRSFSVERSIDGSSFKEIGTVPSGTELVNTYAFTDAQPPVGKVYYRLKRHGNDGATDYSHVLSVYLETAPSLVRINNPAGNLLKVESSTGNGFSNALLLVSDLSGRVLVRETASGHSATLNLSTLPAACYLLQVQQGEQRETLRFIKQ